MTISIRDEVSGIRFVEVSLSMEEFAEAITGLGARPVEADLRGLEHVGKTKVTEARSVAIPDSVGRYDRGAIESWIKENRQEEGWFVDSYLGQQDSLTFDPPTAHYRVYRYVAE